MSRSVLVTLVPLEETEIAALVRRAVTDPRGFDSRVVVTDEAVDYLARISNGDARRALTSLEAAASGASNLVDVPQIEAAVQRVAVRYDKDGDQHYDVISGFIKSVRGSDPDAALHYLARMIDAGEDPRFIARRLMILASEDIGMADSSVLQTAVAAAEAVAMIGMPESSIILAHATIHAALAPKSNAVVVGIGEALADVRSGRIGEVPTHLRDAHYAGAGKLGHGVEYVYPHDVDGGVAQQQYLPEVLADRVYYRPTRHGAEAAWGDIAQRLEQARRGHD